MSKARRLGRGLEALLGKVDQVAEATAANQEAAPTSQPYGAPTLRAPVPEGAPQDDEVMLQVFRPEHDTGRIDVTLIDKNPAQPRQDFDESEIDALAESLKDHGLVQPIVVRPMGKRFQLVAGERRLRAAMKAGWRDVPVQVIDVDDREMAEIALVENVQRKDLNAMEKAQAFRRYLDQFDCKQDELARRVQLDRSTVANFLRLLELPEAIQEAVRRERLSQGHARAILAVEGDEARRRLAERVEREGLSVRATERAAQDILTGEESSEGVVAPHGDSGEVNPAQTAQLRALEQEFRAALGARVKLSHRQNGRGKLVVHFNSHDEFERIREHICGISVPEPARRAD